MAGHQPRVSVSENNQRMSFSYDEQTLSQSAVARFLQDKPFDQHTMGELKDHINTELQRGAVFNDLDQLIAVASGNLYTKYADAHPEFSDGAQRIFRDSAQQAVDVANAINAAPQTLRTGVLEPAVATPFDNRSSQSAPVQPEPEQVQASGPVQADPVQAAPVEPVSPAQTAPVEPQQAAPVQPAVPEQPVEPPAQLSGRAALVGTGAQIVEPRTAPSDDVRRMQQALVDAGYDIGKRANGEPQIDGQEGPNTREALIQAGRDRGFSEEDLRNMSADEFIDNLQHCAPILEQDAAMPVEPQAATPETVEVGVCTIEDVQRSPFNLDDQELREELQAAIRQIDQGTPSMSFGEDGQNSLLIGGRDASRAFTCYACADSSVVEMPQPEVGPSVDNSNTLVAETNNTPGMSPGGA